jgi:hypothetical protein
MRAATTPVTAALTECGRAPPPPQPTQDTEIRSLLSIGMDTPLVTVADFRRFLMPSPMLQGRNHRTKPAPALPPRAGAW